MLDTNLHILSTTAIAVRVNERAAAGGMRIYPNPAGPGTRSLRFVSEKDLSGAGLTLTDALGRRVVSRAPVAGGQAQLGSKPLTPGIYRFVLVQGGTTLAAGSLAVE